MKVIRSRANPLFRTLAKLRDSARERRREASALLDGPHLVGEYLARKGVPRTLAVSAEALDSPEVKALLARARCPEPVVFSEPLFREISPVATPSGILAVVPIPAARPVPHDVACCVLLEDIQDPGNVGSILRSAAAAGVRHVLLSKGCADAWSPRVLRAAMGAHYVLTIAERADLVAFARAYRGQVVAADAKGTRSIHDLDLTPPTAIALGNEGAGLGAELLREADITAAVPMADGVESINVGAAAAVCLFERVRQLQAIRRVR